MIFAILVYTVDFPPAHISKNFTNEFLLTRYPRLECRENAIFLYATMVSDLPLTSAFRSFGFA